MALRPPTTQTAAQRDAEAAKLLRRSLEDARSFNNASTRPAADYTNSVSLMSAFGGLDENGSGIWFPCDYIFELQATKVVGSRTKYWLLEGIVLACGSGATGAMKIKDEEYRDVPVNVGDIVSLKQADVGRDSQGFLKKLWYSMSGHSNDSYDRMGQEWIDAYMEEVWANQTLSGAIFKVRMIPSLNEKESDELGRELKFWHNPSLQACFDPWEDLTVRPENHDWQERWPHLVGAPEDDFSGEAAPAPAPVGRPVAPAPAPVGRPVAPAPAPVGRPVAPAPAPVARPVAPAPVAARPAAPAPLRKPLKK